MQDGRKIRKDDGPCSTGDCRTEHGRSSSCMGTENREAGIFGGFSVNALSGRMEMGITGKHIETIIR